MKLAHIAVALKELKASVPALEAILGSSASSVEEVETERVRLQFLDVEKTRLEFLEPTEPNSPISKFLEKRGPGIHHLAFYVEDLKDTMATLKLKNIRFVYDEPRHGAEGCLVTFIHPSSAGGLLIELIEKK